MSCQPCANTSSAYLVLDKETVQYGVTLAEQTIAPDLLAPFHWLTFISTLYLTDSPSSICQVQATSELAPTLAVAIGHRLVAAFHHWNASLGLSTQAHGVCDEMQPPPKWLRIEWSLTAGGERLCLEVAIDELLPPCNHNDVTVIDTNGNGRNTWSGDCG